MNRNPWPLIVGGAAVVVVIVWVIGMGYTRPTPIPREPPSTPPTLPSHACKASKVKKDPITNLAILLDVSGSFVASDSYPHALEHLANLLPQLDAELPHPLRVRVLPVGNPHRQNLCDIYVPRYSVFEARCPEDGMEYQFNRCRQAIELPQRDRYTDIDSALDRAVLELGVPTPDQVRAIFLLSDLDQDLPPRTVAASADLSLTCVLNVYDHDPSNTGLLARVAYWEERERALHGVVSSQPLRGLKTGLILKFIEECTTRVNEQASGRGH